MTIFFIFFEIFNLSKAEIIVRKINKCEFIEDLAPLYSITAPDYGNLRFIDVHAQNHTLLSLIVIHSTSDPINLHICNEFFFGNLNDIYYQSYVVLFPTNSIDNYELLKGVQKKLCK